MRAVLPRWLSLRPSAGEARSPLVDRVWFLGAILRSLGGVFREPDELLEHVGRIGARSVPVTVITAVFVGGIMAVQVELELRAFGAVSYLGGLSASVTLRTVGPVLVAFLLAGRVGAAAAAELATMRATEQIDGLRALGVDPIRLLAAPRFVAVMLSSVGLLAIGLASTIVGGMAFASLSLGVSHETFLSRLPSLVEPSSLILSLLKCSAFALVIAWSGCWHGYRADAGAVGVGAAVRAAAVESILAILVVNYAIGLVWG